MRSNMKAPIIVSRCQRLEDIHMPYANPYPLFVSQDPFFTRHPVGHTPEFRNEALMTT